MTKKPSEKELEKFFEDGEAEFCPTCSTSNWKVYHKPGEHITKNKEEKNV